MDMTTTLQADGPSLRLLSDSRERYIAQSILHGLVDDPLPSTVEEARDIIDWYSRSQAAAYAQDRRHRQAA